MASARLVPEKKPDVELTLTHEEAEVLWRVTGRTVTGSGPMGALVEDIYCALADILGRNPPTPWVGEKPRLKDDPL